jgi:hypothetical protein
MNFPLALVEPSNDTSFEQHQLFKLELPNAVYKVGGQNMYTYDVLHLSLNTNKIWELGSLNF